MKKIVIVLFLFSIILLTTHKEEYIIPDNAIRFRVIASSNNFEDQATKMIIKNNVENILKNDLLASKNLIDAQNVLQNKIPEIKTMLNTYTTDYSLNLGSNYFPQKTYKGVTYNAGMYESLVITLGSGNGDNWWCVLFPPLCLIEDSTDNLKNAEYSLFVKEFFNKYL